MSKFFIKNEQINDNEIIIIGDTVNHIRNVLRLNINDEIQICDEDTRKNYNCKILEILKEKVICKIINEIECNTENGIYINIFQGIPKADKMEWIIEKCTEIGVSEFTPVKMDRCVVKIDDKSAKKKLERWHKISQAAAMQSGRNIIPVVEKIIDFKDISNYIKEYDLVIVAYEKEEENTIKEELKKIEKLKKKDFKIAVIIGPEGGISDEEIEFVKSLNISVVTLGKRILRTETAPIVVSSIIMYELESNERNIS